MNKFQKIANIERQVYFPNKEDWIHSFWKHDYLILLTSQGIPFAVNADNEQDAMDYIIDYCQRELSGLLMSREEEAEEEYLEDYIRGGNEGLVLNTFNVHIEII